MNAAQRILQTLRLPAICTATGLSRASVYNKWNESSKYFDPTFPRPYKISCRSIGVDAEKLNAWVRARQECGVN